MRSVLSPSAISRSGFASSLGAVLLSACGAQAPATDAAESELDTVPALI